jgi:hypothetical protein
MAEDTTGEDAPAESEPPVDEQDPPIVKLPKDPEQLEYRTGGQRGPVLRRQQDEGGHRKQQSDDH